MAEASRTTATTVMEETQESDAKDILQERFVLLSSGKEQDVKLLASTIQYSPVGAPRTKGKVILLQDIIGVQCMKGKVLTDQRAYLTIYVYPRGRTITGSIDARRCRVVLVFVVASSVVFTDNLQKASLWREAILALLRPISVCAHYSRRWLVLINPAGGPGKAVKLFQERVLPIFSEAEINFDTVISERAGHVGEIVRSLNLDRYSAVILVSGDGLIYEAINGLMERADWRRAIKTPLGLIPAGSGNALAASIHQACGEPFSHDFVKHAALLLTRCIPQPLDLLYVQSLTSQRYAFLSFGWGIIADIDIESEKFRKLGENRFTVGALQRVLDLRSYGGKLSYLPADESNAWLAAPEVDIAASGDYVNVPSRPATNLLVPLCCPLPDSWISVEGQFISVYVTLTSRIAASSVAVPWAQLNDGLGYLCWVKGGLPKTAVTSFLLNLSTGDHLKSPYVQMVAIRAFRLEPRDKDGIMTIDGERIQYGPVQGQMLPSMARVLTRYDGH
ncbi:hypothetical protein RvY_18877 [Ramazzottius varieornatus]|uniref:sphingosine kinase n=1 Tax=Ramazzottius varieornatus TaxID=947166 RepID=A0A1D1W8R1_RAMVA|nr:hypothetical protein RvY_18877 [Ramazzottius varieornatus]